MATPEKIILFLQQATGLSIGYSEIEFADPADLDDMQVGYSIDPDGQSLVNGNKGDWRQEWLVIANDHLGDPIFLDLSQPHYPVLSAEHGEGDWEPSIIADSLDSFAATLQLLHKLAENRSSPDELEDNPISKKEKARVLSDIGRQNPEAGSSFWEVFLEEDED